MKFRVTMKSPDCVSHAVAEAIEDNPGKEDEIDSAISKWFEYHETPFEREEYLEVEIDTVAGTCIVIES